MSYEILPATAAHLPHLARHMREQDRREVEASHALSPMQALDYCLRTAHEAWVGCHEGRPFCIFGVTKASLLGDRAVPWMLGTDDLPRHGKTFAKVSRSVVREWLQDWALLENWVDSRNTVAIGWLRWLGFEIHAAEPHGPFGAPFHRFSMRRP